MTFSALIVAAGRGERAGGPLPKQFQSVGGKPMLRWSVERFAEHPDCAQIIVVHAAETPDTLLSCIKGFEVDLVEGRATRTDSVRQGLDLVSQSNVLIHDAARPLLSHGVIDRLLKALSDHVGAAPALPVADALARQSGNGVEAVSREGLFRMQTPQAFHTEALKTAFSVSTMAYPDEVSLARAHGVDVALTRGDEANFKVTYPDDFARAETLLNAGTTPVTVTGMGYDVHRLDAGEGVHLCGVFIDCNLRLIGHSDADAGLHAITDAVLGAAGLGDIGDHFPPSDDQWKGADSAMFLTHALKLAKAEGVTPVHVDVTLICEKPKIGPHKAAMKARVADLLELDARRVNIKATTTEKLGFTGRGEGLAAEAIVTAISA